MTAKKRYVVEGEWSGYRSDQRRVVHRHVTRHPPKELKTIVFTDDTTLTIRVHPVERYQRVVPRETYIELIEKADRHGGETVRVTDLPKR